MTHKQHHSTEMLHRRTAVHTCVSVIQNNCTNQAFFFTVPDFH